MTAINSDEDAYTFADEHIITTSSTCHRARPVAVPPQCSYKRVKGRSHPVEERISMHSHRTHATASVATVLPPATVLVLPRRWRAVHRDLLTAARKQLEAARPGTTRC